MSEENKLSFDELMKKSDELLKEGERLLEEAKLNPPKPLVVKDLYPEFKRLFSPEAQEAFGNRLNHVVVSANKKISEREIKDALGMVVELEAEWQRTSYICLFLSIRVKNAEDRKAAIAHIADVVNEAAATGKVKGVLSELSSMEIMRPGEGFDFLNFKPAPITGYDDLVFSFFHVDISDLEEVKMLSPYFANEGDIGGTWGEGKAPPVVGAKTTHFRP